MPSDIAQQWGERAAIMQYDGGLSRDRAEIAATMALCRQIPLLKAVPMSDLLSALREAENGRTEKLGRMI